jgi:hypothetical protein
MIKGSVRQLMPSVISPPHCEQMAMTLLLLNAPSIISGRCDSGADGSGPGMPSALRCAYDDDRG